MPFPFWITAEILVALDELTKVFRQVGQIKDGFGVWYPALCLSHNKLISFTLGLLKSHNSEAVTRNARTNRFLNLIGLLLFSLCS